MEASYILCVTVSLNHVNVINAHRVYSISFFLIKISLDPTIMLIIIQIQINRNVERIEK